MLHVGLLYGGHSSEHDISILSARNVLAALDPARYHVTPVRICRAGRWYVEPSPEALRAGAPEPLEDARPVLLAPAGGRHAALAVGPDGAEVAAFDVVIPMLHGQNGEDGTVQGLLTALGVPFVGPGVLGSAVCMDKDTAKRLLAHAGLPVTPSRTVRQCDPAPRFDDLADELGAPLFVKPANSGSSVGVSKVTSAAELEAALALAFAYDRKVLVETAIDGREIEVAVLGNERPETSVPGEIVSEATFYTYDAKYLDPTASRMVVPAEIPDAVAARVREVAAAAFTALECEGMARVDCFVTPAGDVLVNEVNTIPGFTSRSMYPVMWEASGLPYGALLDRLIELALARHARDRALKTSRT